MSPRTACATRSTSSSWSRRAPSCAAPARPAMRGCARSTTSARRRSASTRPRRSTTASAARRLATCSRSSRRPRAWTSRARSSCWPNATGWSFEREQEDPREAERRRRRERLLELLARTTAYYERCLWESGEAERAREYLDGPRPGGGDPEGVPRRLRTERMGPRAHGLAPGRVLRAGALRDGIGPALQAERAALRSLSLADHVPAGGHPWTRARLRRARHARGAATEVPEHLRQRRLPQGSSPLRRPSRTPPRRTRGAGRRRGDRVRGLHRHDRPAPGGHAQRGGTHGNRSHGRAGRGSWRGWLRRCCSPSMPTARARRRCCGHPAWRRSASSSFVWWRCPTGTDPADLLQREGPEAMSAIVRESVPFVRFRVERVLAAGDHSSPEGHDRMLAELRPVFETIPPSADAHGADEDRLRTARAAREPRRDAALLRRRTQTRQIGTPGDRVHGARGNAGRPAAPAPRAREPRRAGRTPSARSSRSASPLRRRGSGRLRTSTSTSTSRASCCGARPARLREGDLREPMANRVRQDDLLDDDPELRSCWRSSSCTPVVRRLAPRCSRCSACSWRWPAWIARSSQARGREGGDVSELAQRRAEVKREFDRAYGRVLEETGDRPG